jgi:hypothetical protein
LELVAQAILAIGPQVQTAVIQRSVQLHLLGVAVVVLAEQRRV